MIPRTTPRNHGEQRPEFKATGTLTITSASTQKGGLCEPINFDPMVIMETIINYDDLKIVVILRTD